MIPPKLILLKLLTLYSFTYFINFASAKNLIILAKENSIGPALAIAAANNFSDMLIEVGIEAHILQINLNSLLDEKEPLGIDKNYNLIGFIILAHGNSKSLALYDDKPKNFFYNLFYTKIIEGKEFADALGATLPIEDIKGSFFIHFHSCSLGERCFLKKNFQDSFYNQIKINLSTNSNSKDDLPAKLNFFFISAFSNATTFEIYSSAYLEKELTPYISKFERRFIKYLIYSMSEKTAKKYEKSYLRKFFSWYILPIDHPLKFSTIMASATWFGYEFLDFKTTILLLTSLHIWSFHNLIFYRTSARIRKRTSDKEFPPENYSHVRDLFRKNLLPKNRIKCLQLFSTL